MAHKLYILQEILLFTSLLIVSIHCKRDNEDPDILEQNTRPQASLLIQHNQGSVTDRFYFDATGCRDKEDADSMLEVRWDWEKDGSWDTDYSVVKLATHQYHQKGQYIVLLQVRDSDGLTDEISASIEVIDDSSASSCPGISSVDYGGQTYSTVQIGEQCWLRENINIGNSISGDSEQADNGKIEKYCYNNIENNCTRYGGLYQWDEAMAYDNEEASQGICPPAWHIPTDTEWKILQGAVDTKYGIGDPEWDIVSHCGFDVGGNLKEAGNAHWTWPNWGATNSSGFTGLPSGTRNTNTNFYDKGGFGYFWTSTPKSSTTSWYRYLHFNSRNISRLERPLTNGLSVRCIKD